MRIRFCCNVYFDGKLFKAGEFHSVADEGVVSKLERRGLVEALDSQAQEKASEVETVKPKATKKASKKGAK